MAVEDLGELFDVELLEDATTSRPSAGCWPRRSAGCRSRARRVTVDGLKLTAESTGGRRNRIDTVLVHRERARDGNRSRTPAEQPVER